MLERLQLRNFQSHEDLRIRFDSRITTIIGPSDSGKSAVVRALRWLAFNRPGGEAFVRDGSDSATVSVWVVEGTKLSRSKGGDNTYGVNRVVYKSFGSDVPEAVSSALNLGHVNFQQQHDSPYWFAQTPGQVAKELNSIVDLEVIDRTLAGVASEQRKAKAEAEVIGERLEGAKAERERLDYVPVLEEEFDALKSLKADSDAKMSEAASGGRLVGEAESHQGRAERLSEAKRGGSAAMVVGERALRLGDRANVLRELAREGCKLRGLASREVPNMGRIEAMRKEWEELESNLIQISRCEADIKASEGRTSECRTRLNNAAKKLKKQMEGQCPLCGGKMEDDECDS